MLIGRDEERALLLDALESGHSELIVVHGRRRIGKTFLIRSVYEGQVSFEFSGMHRGAHRQQLKNFHMAFPAKARPKAPPADWIDAFDRLGRYLDKLKGKAKKVVFIDEFPWLDGHKSGFLAAFTNFWNGYATKRNDLVVVICGSAASYMIKRVINNKGGLHNRLTRRIRLAPFNLCETEQLLRHNKVLFTRYDILQLYMVLGGVPYYLHMVKRGESVAQAIDRLCFDRQGFLRGEFNNVFASLFDNAGNHEAIVRALSLVRKGLTRNAILKKSKVPSGGTLSNTLMELEESGFIEHYAPYDAKKDPLYRITDEYTQFYLRYIEPSTPSKRGVWSKLSGTPGFKAWAGFSFETICMKHVEGIKEGLRIGGVRSVEGSWIGKGDESGAQIDLLIDRDDNVINLCEMKFAGGSFTIDRKYANELMTKAGAFRTATRTRKSIFITFITTHGLAHNAYSRQLVQNELTMDALFTSV
ncbi:MAG: AAA family ATPase [Flavobacteriales bacterium]|nr:AAA family ATPase [Flavobacteriales bacterium]MBK7941258.1 AAA family ATPase [Flavobacteriales bacterium]MBK8948666.1 AAA family ATPase [Flavobacteriales bacterium]MBK9701284.1 AAA family ATPase [Flavobacteriales bacterium]